MRVPPGNDRGRQCERVCVTIDGVRESVRLSHSHRAAFEGPVHTASASSGHVLTSSHEAGGKTGAQQQSRGGVGTLGCLGSL